MNSSQSFFVCFLFLMAGLVTTACAQHSTAADSLVNKLPTTLRERGQAILNALDEKQRTQLTDDLARQEPVAVMEFLIGLLDSDPAAPVRRSIITRLGNRPEPAMQLALERHAASDADADVALLCLNRLRQQRLNQLRQVLNKRLEMAQQSGNPTELQKLLQEQERWIALVNGTMLPSFMRVTPPLFALKPKGKVLRVITLGDYGQGAPENGQIAGEAQKQVAAAMLKAHKSKAFDFGITLGDNFYPIGMHSPSDPRWQTLWRDLYDPLKLKFYVTFGNHDWGGPDSPAAELIYAKQSPNWVLPAPYYTFTAGPVQFFALDTNEVSELQLSWLRDELAKSTARWKVVYGHHPIYSAGQHGDGRTLIAKLLPVLKDRVDIYFAGHEHDMQHLQAEGSVHFFINGGGGAKIRDIKPNARSLFAKSAYGFSILEADNDKLVVKFIGTDLGELYQYTLTKAKSESIAAGAGQK
ncbi:MAG TPA: metallophosphoesterase [Blastocatellia bacterium]|nr:metallophosphoesterase [Blastocatellia bacterium]